MIIDTDKFYISRLLQPWYAANKRELPWRETRDPYKIWISEIILQQTRVNQGMDYYFRFIAAFPDVKKLAAASETEVLKLWQGLGYYSRARNLHAAAKQIVENFNAEFPQTYKEIRSLKGIGEYTSAAILSIAFKQPYAVVDGNVYRVLSRLFAIDLPIDSTAGKKYFAETAQFILDTEQPDIHNQAMMDLGAMVCTPKNPDCTNCPLNKICAAVERGEISKYPVTEKKTKTRNRYFHYFYITDNENTWIHQRTGNDIWKNLYEFPLIETDNALDLEDLQKNEEYRKQFPQEEQLLFSAPFKTKHILSHQTIYASFFRVTNVGKKNIDLPKIFQKIKMSDLHEYPVSRLTLKFLEKII